MTHRIRPLFILLLIAGLLLGSPPFSSNQVWANPPGLDRWLRPSVNDWFPLSTGTNADENLWSVEVLAFQPDGQLIAGGNFHTMGACVENCGAIARWNPTARAWSPVESGTSISGAVQALAVGSTGVIYAGGQVYSAGTCAGGFSGKCNGIAQWDPTSEKWTAMANGLGEGSMVNTIAIDPTDGSVYAGGNFYSVGYRIAEWNPSSSTWSALGSGITSPMNAQVYAAAVGASGSVYVGGIFDTAGTCDSTAGCNNIAQWNGASWSALGGGVNGRVYALAVSPKTGLVYVGGDFTSAGAACDSAAGCSSIAQWNPATSTWSALGSGIGGTVRALAFDKDGNLFAGGTFSNAGAACDSAAGCNSIAEWNPTTKTWSALGSGISSIEAVYAIAPDAGLEVYAGGWFHGAGSCSGAAGCWSIGRYHNGPPPAVITFGAAPSPTYLTDASFTVSASSSNTDSGGNVLAFSQDSGPCAQVGSSTTFTITGAGDCVVKAEGIETANFGSASKTLTVTIAKAQPVITFTSSAEVQLTTGTFSAAATTTNTDSKDLTYSWVSGPCADFGGGLFFPYALGTCVIRADGGATTNFEPAFAEQPVTINAFRYYFILIYFQPSGLP